ncbi:MAG: alpha-D-glucose phosphate-specific phosphoglucomutase, partial [Marinosulfonomonas sp.]|nr:alpha-D-glucose phosphate-specific phosphoglucomutase [Marinosulfonomonas sp.]
AQRGQPVAEIMAEHWQEFGRNYYSRHDYEAVPADAANQLMAGLQAKLPELVGKEFSGARVSASETFSYIDPVDRSVSENQGIIVHFEGQGRAVLRLSGTGTQGATLRIYLEQYVERDADHSIETQTALSKVKNAILEITQIQMLIGRTLPDVMS